MGSDDDAGQIPLDELDDTRDRAELRGRYEVLLQELRVVLPGVQVLLGFLFTVPFTERFSRITTAVRTGYTVTLLATAVAAVCLISPSVLHRVAERTARRIRLQWGLRLSGVGLVCLGIAMVSGLWTVSTLIYADHIAWTLTVAFAAVLLVVWIVIPVASRHHRGGPGPRLGR